MRRTNSFLLAAFFVFALCQAAWAAGPAKNVIVLIADGAGAEQYTLARWFKGAPLAQDAILTGMVRTFIADSVVADSAPAGTAYATGVRTSDKHISVGPKAVVLTGQPVPPEALRFRPLASVLEGARLQGRATGIVATSRVTHATPAAWVSHQPHRDSEDEIASELLAFRPNVLLGGGKKHFSPKARKDGQDLMAQFAQAGYDTATDRAALIDLPHSAKPLVGLFNNSHISYYVDRLNDPKLSSQPSLPEMTTAALRRLSENPAGFLLQVEAGRIDHASHSNDAWASIMETIELDDTLAVIDAFLKVNPRTLVIVTSDHGNSGWGVNGTGPNYNDATSALRNLRAGKASFEVLIERMKGKNAGEIQALVAEATGFPISAEEAALVLGAMQPGYECLAGDFVYQPDATLGLLMSRSVYSKKGGPTLRRGNVGFTSCNHTAEDQVLLAYGHKAKDLNLGRLVDNTELFGAMCRFFGIRHVNPTMTLAEAKPHLQIAEQQADARLHIA